jgi:type 1 glutamine amidotransferase
MRNLMGRLAVLATALVTTVAGVTSTACAADDPYSVLVFSKTAGFRHDSIAAGIQAIQALGSANNFSVTATEDAAAFTAPNLAQYDAVVFLNTTGDVLNASQQTAFEGYIAAGNGYVGVHAAADTEYDWPFYGELVGAYFLQHPAIQPARVVIEDRAHAATAHLGTEWTRTDEWYSFRTNPRSSAHVLASLDESSYSGGGMGDHPITWCRNHGGGRSFYTGFGHTNESYADQAVRGVLLGGIRWAAGRTKADCRPETGYTALYNGSTTGWSQAGPGGFTNADATLTSTGGLGMLWYSAKEFRSYSLKADWRLAGDDNSGIFIGFPPSNDPWSAVDNGYEIQIDATDSPDRTTGSVYGFKGPDTAARDAALNPPGEWNTFELLVEGERVQVFLNGVKINDFTNTDPVRSLTSGHIGIQNHGDGDEASFRNIRIRELGATTDTTFQAEDWTAASGVDRASHPPAHGGFTLGFIDSGDWAGYGQVNLAGTAAVRARVSSGGAGGTVSLRSGSQSGPVLGTLTVPNTGGWETFMDVSTTITAGSGPLFLTFTGGSGALLDVDDVTLVRSGTGAGPVVGVAGKCVDVSNSATADGTKVQLWGCNGTGAQRWARTGQTVRALGKCLDVSGGATANGTKVQLWTCNGSGAQNWVPQANGTVRNPQSNRCLEAPGGQTGDGTGLRIWDCTTGANQRWAFRV